MTLSNLVLGPIAELPIEWVDYYLEAFFRDPETIERVYLLRHNFGVLTMLKLRVGNWLL